ncbi:hypothetical protein [Gemmobacter caeruleus]|uniref:hypothetical protein n=1 Tax=Gemmobacter caeruleus TaxID=2595004 RepID=UPI001396B1C3|nr:hypothetical protein [Gemmobacter caeruleus]
MTVELQDGIRVLKLKDSAGARGAASDDALTLLHLWRLLGGDHMLRDMTISPRRFL